MTDSQKETDLAKQEVRRSPRGRQPIMGGRLKTSGVTKPTLKSVSSDPKLSLKVSLYCCCWKLLLFSFSDGPITIFHPAFVVVMLMPV